MNTEEKEKLVAAVVDDLDDALHIGVANSARLLEEIYVALNDMSLIHRVVTFNRIRTLLGDLLKIIERDLLEQVKGSLGIRHAGALIRLARKNHKYTQTYIEEQTGIDRTTISRYETGDQMPKTYQNLVKLSQLLWPDDDIPAPEDLAGMVDEQEDEPVPQEAEGTSTDDVVLTKDEQ